MPDWTVSGGLDTRGVGYQTASSDGTGFTADASAAKGAWVELSASTPINADALLVQLRGDNAGTSFLVDLGIGAAGSEVVIASDLVSFFATVSSQANILLPITLPAGMRLAVRGACSSGSSRPIVAAVMLMRGGFANDPGFQLITSYGFAAGSPTPTNVPAGSAANTKGSWVEITSGTARAHKAATLFLGRGNTGQSDNTWLVDIGVGAAGAEQVVLPNLMVRQAGNEVHMPYIGPLPLALPAGTRIAARAQSSVASTSLYVGIYGFA